MTDRVHSLTVVLEHNTRTDDIDPLVAAIKQLRNVATVGLDIADPVTYMAEARAKSELTQSLLDVLIPKAGS